MAVTCGTPTPATTRVVQIEPGPTPTLTRVGAGVDERLGALAGRDVAADDLHVPVAGSFLRRRDHVEQQPGVPVGGVDDEHVDAGLDQGGGALPGVAEVADGGADQEPASASFVASGNCSDFTKSLTVIRPREPARVVDQRQPLDLVLASSAAASSRADADAAGDRAASPS